MSLGQKATCDIAVAQKRIETLKEQQLVFIKKICTNGPN